ncbi:MAG: HEAT repeat domain-containing protein [Planctomycetota bacterium]
MTFPVAMDPRWDGLLSALFVALLGLTAGCSTAEEARYTPGSLDRDQKARCREVAQAFLDSSEAYPELRDDLLSDPVATRWYVRYLISVVVEAREGRAELLQEERVRVNEIKKRRDQRAGGQGTGGQGTGGDWSLPGQRKDRRAIDQIVAVGEPAVEVVVEDLLLFGQEFLRTIGVEVLAGIGSSAVPTLLARARTGSDADLRAVARALGAIGPDGAALDALGELAGSAAWQVRSDVARALGGGGAAARAMLVRMLDDEDPFVRRQACAALGRHQDDVAAAIEVLDYMQACQKSEDFKGELAAQEALQNFSGTRRPRSAAAWRKYLEGRRLESRGGQD